MTPVVFHEFSEPAKQFYEQHGYVHLRPSDPGFAATCLAAFEEAHRLVTSPPKAKIAFVSKDGAPRHLVDVLDDGSVFRRIVENRQLQEAYKGILGDQKLIFTHGKISFKTPKKEVPWFPHQDNGYKVAHSYLRRGFAAFVFLEDADQSNGTLELFPGSHLRGTLPHKKVLEDHARGDFQVALRDPLDLPSIYMVGQRGDVVLFSGDMVHQSGISSTSSHRLALIAEVEPINGYRLDDLGRRPVLALGEWSNFERLAFDAKALFSPRRYWQPLRRSTLIMSAVRRIRARLSPEKV